MLWELLTGEEPYQDLHYGAIIGNLLNMTRLDVECFHTIYLRSGSNFIASALYVYVTGGIVSNSLRPPVPEFCDPEWRSLMERCWSAEPSERPNFTEVANQLRTMAAKVPQKVQAQQQPSSTPPQV